MDISKFSSYKAIIKELIKTYPNKGRGVASRLATFLNVNTTFVSQVLIGDKHLSLEQGIKVTHFFEFSELEKEYFLTLINFERSGTKDLENYFELKLSAIKNQFQNIKSRVGNTQELTDSDKAIYYSDWKYQAVKLATSLDDCNSLREISHKLDVPMAKLHSVFEFLIEKGLIKQNKNKLSMGIAKTHVPASSPLVKRHHVNWRLKAIEHYEKLSDTELGFTAPLTISEKDFAIIREEILKFIQDLSKRVEKSDSEIVACLNIDWFKA